MQVHPQSLSPVPAVFSFESHEVRTTIVGEDVWFVARDIAAVLGYAKPENAIFKHCKYAKTLTSPDLREGLSVPGNTLFIPERDVYRLIMRSTLPAAERFEEWVVSEVIPSIRKHGHYQAPVPALPTDPMQLLKLTYDALEQVTTRVADVEAVSQETKARLDDFEATLPLRPHEARSIQAEVTAKVTAIHERFGIYRRLLFSSIYGFLKRHFVVPTYSAIPSQRFEEARMVVKGLSLEQLPPEIGKLAKGGTPC